MADKKISALTPITGANVADDDEFVLVDTSADETKAITFSELKTAFDTSTGFVRITGDTMTGGLTVPTVDINGGTIDGTVIGGSTPAAISGTTGTFSGNLTVDTNTLFVDAANNRVGVGTSSPNFPLTVEGSVRAGSGTVANNYSFSLQSGTSDTTTFTRYGSGIGEIRHFGGGAFQVVTQTAGDLIFGTDATERMRITSTGRVGIGTSSPFAKLSVQTADLGTTAGDSVQSLSLRSDTSNSDFMLFTAERTSTGTSWTTAAHKMQRKVDSTLMGYMQFGGNSSDLITFGEDATEYMRIDGSGNVGIGTSSPVVLLDVLGNGLIQRLRSTTSTSAYLRFDGTGTSFPYVGLLGGIGTFGNTDASPIRFNTNNAERMRIDGSGNVGIGTSSPTQPLEVVGTTRLSGVSPRLSILDTNSATDEKEWSIIGVDGPLQIQALNDAGAGSGDLLQITRVGSGVRSIRGVRSGLTTYELNNFDRSLFFSGGESTIGTATAHDLVVDTNNIERMRIDSGGNVGIGTSNPSSSLHVAAGSSGISPIGVARQIVESSGATGIQIASGGTGVSYLFMGVNGDSDATRIAAQNGFTQISATGASDYMRFETGGFNERMRITSSGDVGIGTTSDQLAVTTGASGHYIKGSSYASFSDDSGIAFAVNRTGTDGAISQFRKAGTIVGTISVTATTTAYNTSSDYRLKEDVQPMVGASGRVLALNPVNFAWKVNGSRVDGFLAHEAQVVVPEAVTGEKDGEEMQAIDQSKLVPLLTAALQEALTEIADLKARVAALEAQP